jgi:hypothetical protein
MRNLRTARYCPRLATIPENTDAMATTSEVWKETLIRLFHQASEVYGHDTYNECTRMCRNLLGCNALEEHHRTACLRMLRYPPRMRVEEHFAPGAEAAAAVITAESYAPELSEEFYAQYCYPPSERELFVFSQLQAAQVNLNHLRGIYHMYEQPSTGNYNHNINIGINTCNSHSSHDNSNTCDDHSGINKYTNASDGSTQVSDCIYTPSTLSPLSPSFSLSASYAHLTSYDASTSYGSSTSAPQTGNSFLSPTDQRSGDIQRSEPSTLSAMATPFSPSTTAVSSSDERALHASCQHSFQQHKEEQQQYAQ